jgi:hypothetical protein
MRDVLNGGWFYRSSNFMNAGIEKTTLEEWEGVYVGVRAQPEPPHSGPLLAFDYFSVES